MTRQELYDVLKDSQFTQDGDWFSCELNFIRTQIKLEEKGVAISTYLVPSVFVRAFKYEDLTYYKEHKVLSAGIGDGSILIALKV